MWRCSARPSQPLAGARLAATRRMGENFSQFCNLGRFLPFYLYYYTPSPTHPQGLKTFVLIIITVQVNRPPHTPTGHPSGCPVTYRYYSLNLFFSHPHASLHISSIPFSAFQPSSRQAFDGSDQTEPRSPARRPSTT